jgi:hypothetical protein
LLLRSLPLGLRVSRRMNLVFGRCRVPTCYNPFFSGVPRKPNSPAGMGLGTSPRSRTP